jgi:hypothetical protein
MKRLRNDDGFSLVEVIAFLGIFGVVIALLVSALNTTQVSLARQTARSQSNDEVRLAAQALDREVRSGDLIYDPSLESYTLGQIHSGYSIRLLSEANVPTRGGKRCVQFRITDEGELQRREWIPAWVSSADVSGWRTLATGIRNRTEGLPAFSRPQVNLLKVVLLANERPGDGPISGQVKTVRIDLAVSGRNSALVSDLQQCGPSQPEPLVPGNGGSRVPPY